MASSADRAAMRASHAAAAAERRLDQIDESTDDAKDLIRRGFDLLENVTNAKAEANRAALFNRV